MQSHHEERLEQLMMHSTGSSGSKTVLTVSMQATDLNERLTTGRQIFSMAIGQGSVIAFVFVSTIASAM